MNLLLAWDDQPRVFGNSRSPEESILALLIHSRPIIWEAVFQGTQSSSLTVSKTGQKQVKSLPNKAEEWRLREAVRPRKSTYVFTKEDSVLEL